MKHSIILIVGDAAPQYAELSNEEISELWVDVQSRCLPKVLLGWFDERNKFCQMTKRDRFSQVEGRMKSEKDWTVLSFVATSTDHGYWTEIFRGTEEECGARANQSNFPTSLKIVHDSERHRYTDY
jgi:hypothetical protein